MNKILAFFPLNKGIQKGAGKKLLFGLLKYLGLWIGSALIMRILGRIPLVGNLIYHLGRILDIYCPIGMITAIIQLLAVADDTEIEYIGAGKIKELLVNKKVLIGVAIAAVALCIIPKSIWTGGSKNKSVNKKDEKVAEAAKDEDKSEEKKEEAKKEEPEKETEEVAEAEPAEEIVYEVPEELKSVQGYVDDNGEIVYGEWPTDENCWWALRNYADVKTKLPVYAKTSNGDIRYDLTWDTTAGHWHLVKYYKDEVQSDELYDDDLVYPIGYTEPAYVMARRHSFDYYFPAEELFKNYASWDVDDYGNEYRLFRNNPNTYFAGVRVKDPDHILSSITIDVENVAEGLGEGDTVPVVSIISWPKDSKKAEIPSFIVRIEDEAFYGREELEEVSMPDGLFSIGKEAFWGCTNLKSVRLGNSLDEIDNYAFCRCENLKEISLPDGVSFIAYPTVNFEDCDSVQWNGKTYTDINEFQEEFKESGGGILEGNLATFGQ